MVQVDVPSYKPDRIALLTSCYCAALTRAICTPRNINDNLPDAIALPLLGVGKEGWSAEISAKCLLHGLHQFYDFWYSNKRIAKRVFLCAEKQYQPALRMLLKNRSLAFMSIPVNSGRYDPDTWRELRNHFLDPQYNNLTHDEFFAMCLDRLYHMTGVKPALKVNGSWTTTHDWIIPVSYQSWLQVMLPALIQRFCQLWPESCAAQIRKIVIPYFGMEEYEWQLPELPVLDDLLSIEHTN